MNLLKGLVCVVRLLSKSRKFETGTDEGKKFESLIKELKQQTNYTYNIMEEIMTSTAINNGYNPYQYQYGTAASAQYQPYLLNATHYAPIDFSTVSQAVQPQGQVAGASEQNAEAKEDKNDGKIGFWKATGHLLKGVWNFATSPFKNARGEWSLWSTIKSAAVAALFIAGNVATGGALTPLLLAAGAIGGTVGAGKAIYNIATAKTDAEDAAAWESLGSSTTMIAASALGAKGYAKSTAAQQAEAEALAAGATNAQAAAAAARTAALEAGASEAEAAVAAEAAKAQALAAAQAQAATAAEEAAAAYNGFKGGAKAVGKTFSDTYHNSQKGYHYVVDNAKAARQAYKDGTLKEKVSDKWHTVREKAVEYKNAATDKFADVRQALADKKATYSSMTPQERRQMMVELAKTVKDNAPVYFEKAKNGVQNPKLLALYSGAYASSTIKPDFYDCLSPAERQYFDTMPKAQQEEILALYYGE